MWSIWPHCKKNHNINTVYYNVNFPQIIFHRTGLYSNMPLCQYLSIIFASTYPLFLPVPVHYFCQYLSTIFASTCPLFLPVHIYYFCQYLSIIFASTYPLFLPVPVHYFCQYLSTIFASTCPLFLMLVASIYLLN